MTYAKLLVDGHKRHLVVADQLADGQTLCGSTFTRIPSWTRIDHLEGDECERCAAAAFSFNHRISATEPVHEHACV